MRSLSNLSNELLIQTYIKSVQIKLNEHFIYLIQMELEYRGIDINNLETENPTYF